MDSEKTGDQPLVEGGGPTVAELQAELVKARDEALAHQKNVGKRDAEILRVKQDLDEAQSWKQELDFLKTVPEDGEEKPAKELFAQWQKQQKTENQKQRQMRAASTELSKITSIIEDAGFDTEDEDFAEAAFYAKFGDYKLATKKAKSAIAAKGKKEVKDEETEEVRIERKAREMLEKKGVLKPEKSTPSGGGQLTIAGLDGMSNADITKLRKEHGGKSLMELIDEGVIKK